MAVSRITKSSVLQGFPKSRSLLAGNTAYDPAATWLIQRVAGTGSSGTITFSSIPQTYKHLQIRVIAKTTDATSSLYNANLTFNSDSGSNYAFHRLIGDGTSATASGSATQTKITINNMSAGNSITSTVGAVVIDIHDYASTTKYKTVRTFQGVDTNTTTGRLELNSGLWMSTSAISTITLVSSGTAFTTASTFALYGMVG